MAFYDLSKTERIELVEKINNDLHSELKQGKTKRILAYFSDEDTYI